MKVGLTDEQRRRGELCNYQMDLCCLSQNGIEMIWADYAIANGCAEELGLGQ